jgi:hypothetical protein
MLTQGVLLALLTAGSVGTANIAGTASTAGTEGTVGTAGTVGSVDSATTAGLPAWLVQFVPLELKIQPPLLVLLVELVQPVLLGQLLILVLACLETKPSRWNQSKGRL